jgi:hypothetical protein
MKKGHLYIVALLCALLGFGVFLYKWKVLKFPVQPVETVQVWTIEAHVSFKARSGGNKVRLNIPSDPPGYAILSEDYVSRNWGKAEDRDPDGSRAVEWTRRRAQGQQSLYYRTTVYFDDHETPREPPPPFAKIPPLEEPYATARAGLIEQVREQSADVSTFTSQLLMRLNDPSPVEEAALFMKDVDGPFEKANLAARLLAGAQIPARVVHAIPLKPNLHEAVMEPWLQVHNQERWLTFNINSTSEGLPPNLFIWSTAPGALLDVGDNSNATIGFTVATNTDDAMAVMQDRRDVLESPLVKYSLLSLPLEKRNVYQFLLLIPIGAFVMLILRNIIGIKTFGTFMPVLIALAFRETELLAGIALFVVIVGFGLLVRFYMERLKLLLVPRLTAVLTLVVFLMCMTSILSHQLDIEVGLSVGLFPMVIMAMTIERMCIAWDERGPGSAIRDAAGSLAVAAIAHMVMTWRPLEHLILTFPELLLVLFAATLLLGRYAGYRLTELGRFKALARERALAKQAAATATDEGR